jgi:hypothetical protein
MHDLPDPATLWLLHMAPVSPAAGVEGGGSAGGRSHSTQEGGRSGAVQSQAVHVLQQYQQEYCLCWSTVHAPFQPQERDLLALQQELTVTLLVYLLILLDRLLW